MSLNIRANLIVKKYVRECVLDITIVIVANICKQFAVDDHIRGGATLRLADPVLSWSPCNLLPPLSGKLLYAIGSFQVPN